MRKFFSVLFQVISTAAALTTICFIYSKAEMEPNTIIVVFLVLLGVSTTFQFLIKSDSFWNWIEATFGETLKEGELFRTLMGDGLMGKKEKWREDIRIRRAKNIIDKMTRGNPK